MKRNLYSFSGALYLVLFFSEYLIATIIQQQLHLYFKTTGADVFEKELTAC